MTTYNNVLGVFSYAAHTLANTLWSERAFSDTCKTTCTDSVSSESDCLLNVSTLLSGSAVHIKRLEYPTFYRKFTFCGLVMRIFD